MSGTIPAFITARRSIRSFADDPVSPELLDTIVEAACLAPAPHHSRPWRFAVVAGDDTKRALAEAMAARWHHDLEADGIDAARIAELMEASCTRIRRAPALVLACLTWEGLDRYPDERRRRAEWGMALLSLGAAVENLMLAATDLGLATCWVAAPIFCPDMARDALRLPDDWLPQAMVLTGWPDPSYRLPDRPSVPLDGLRRHL